MPKILIVEDEEAIHELISMNLRLVGYEYVDAYNGAEALDAVDRDALDLVLLDVLLPEMDGFSVMEKIKDKGIPVIFITACDSLPDRMKGFTLGAEDYITKPFEVLELLARIKVVLRRNKRAETEYRIGDVCIKVEERNVYKGGAFVPLTAQEFSLLLALIENKNIALSREKLLEIAWGFDYEGDTRTVDVHIRKLRQKLGWEEHIRTVYKMGYRLEVPR